MIGPGRGNHGHAVRAGHDRSGEDAIEFRNIFDAMMIRAYLGLWAGAYLLGGCGDDTFSDFRSAQISRGRRAFERALTTGAAFRDWLPLLWSPPQHKGKR